jgi:hypothetical protein
MGILNIRPVELTGVKIVLGIAGTSGSGKTYTAIKIARGMVDKPSEIGFLDTENKRGSLYYNILDAPFLIADLYPPFSPRRYITSIKEFQESGIKVLVIDSISHEWEGEGGCDDIANAPKADGSERKVANWIGAKKEHKAFMNALLQSNVQIICCIRAREKTDFKNPAKPISQGIQPICEKSFMFEMTASVMMDDEGKKQTWLKMPEFLKEAFGDGTSYIGEETGKKIMEWVNTGKKEDPIITKLKSEMLMECEKGLDALVAVWKKVPKKYQKELEDHKNLCKESAMEYDTQRKEASETPSETLERNIQEAKNTGTGELFDAKGEMA